MFNTNKWYVVRILQVKNMYCNCILKLVKKEKKEQTIIVCRTNLTFILSTTKRCYLTHQQTCDTCLLKYLPQNIVQASHNYFTLPG